MPPYEPNAWNTPTLNKINNCYNYCTNKKNELPPGGKPVPEPAQPGFSKKVTAKQYKKTVKVGKEQYPVYDYECEGIKTAAMLDGLDKLNENNQCEANCWMVAYYVRRYDEKKKLPGDFHFVRQDGPNKWSHKPGNLAVTDQKYNPKTDKYDAGPITDPSKDSIGLLYTFCGYLCVCPNDVKVASLPPEDSPSKEGSVMVTLGGDMGMAVTTAVGTLASAVDAAVDAVAERLGGEWIDDMGDGSLLYRVDILGDEPTARRTIFVTDESLTLWDEAPRHLADPGGRAGEQFARLFGFTGPKSGAPWGDWETGTREIVAVSPCPPTRRSDATDRLLAWAAVIAAVGIPVAIVLAGLILGRS